MDIERAGSSRGAAQTVRGLFGISGWQPTVRILGMNRFGVKDLGASTGLRYLKSL